MEAKKMILREQRNEYRELTAEAEAKLSAAGRQMTVATGWEERVARLLMDATFGKETRGEHQESDEPGQYIYPVSVEVKTGKILGGQFTAKNQHGRLYSGTRQFFKARIVAEPLEMWGTDSRRVVVLVQMLSENRDGGVWVPETWPLSHFLAKVGSPEEIIKQTEARLK